MQSTSPGSGSHTPFSVHTDALGPVWMNPDGQVYDKYCPSNLGTSDSVTMTTGSFSDCVDG
jgi:hypothetical protein